MPGPVPKRSDQKRHRIKPAIPVRKGKAQPFVEAPPAEEWWHPDARAFYDSLPLSGQSVYYEPSDWRLAHWVCRAMTELANAEQMNAALFKQVLDACDTLMVSEGARRRKGVELVREPTLDVAPVVSSRSRDRKLLEAVKSA